MFGLDALFDFDHDGELDTFETATQYYAISVRFVGQQSCLVV